MSVGIVLNKKVGDKVKAGESLLTIHSNREQVDDVIEKLNASITISDSGKAPTLIHTVKRCRHCVSLLFSNYFVN